ncbi:MAG: hypothetical protein EOP54_26575, partial [Sphingobacteriales bacterium]
MKRNLLLCAALLYFSVQGVQAQFLKNLKKKAEAAVNKAIDENTTTATKKQPAQQAPAEQTTDAPAPQQPAAAEKSAPLQAYAKYDFIPGQNLIYADNFAGEAVGELPAGWNSNGNGAVTKLNNFSGNWMRMDQ